MLQLEDKALLLITTPHCLLLRVLNSTGRLLQLATLAGRSALSDIISHRSDVTQPNNIFVTALDLTLFNRANLSVRLVKITRDL